tara:strand:+ start:2289 stop:4322 length:2034 start_codon:yes stop_codon:yes gene_type:complete
MNNSDNKSFEFDSLFSDFAKYIKLPTNLFSEKSLRIFCELVDINYEDRYISLVEEPKFMHMFVCYLMTSVLHAKTKDTIILKNSDSAAVIVEDRKLPHLEFMLRNAIYRLPNNWSHTLVCSKKSYKVMAEFCGKINKNINVICLPDNNLTHSSYNDLLLSKEFWNLFDSENILIYQTDSIIFREGIKEFLDFDFVGSPWPHSDDNHFGVGNGGFSFRKKSKLLNCLDKINPSELELGETTKGYMKNHNMNMVPEDVYFTKTMIDFDIGRVADIKTANKFSQERIFSKNPFGGHQYWIADARLSDERKTVLVIDDKLAVKHQGQGFGRAQSLLDTMSKHFRVTLYPTNFLEEEHDKRMDYYKKLGIRVICKPRPEYGNEIFVNVGNHIKDNDYDIIFISRPHNYREIIEYCKTNADKSKVVYDAEALSYERAFLKRDILGNPSTELCNEEKTEELALLSQTENIIVVSEREKNMISTQVPSLKENILVYGHALLPNWHTGYTFDERENLFFLGAFVEEDSPNTDALVYFAKEVFPIVEKELGCKLIVGGSEPTNRVMELDNDKIIIKGFIEDTQKYYNECKLFVSPQRFAAGIPYKLSEAMSYGIPVVGSKLMATQMNLNKDTMGIGSNASEIASEIIDMYTNKERWRLARKNSLKFIQETHNPNILNSQLVEYLTSM